MKTFYTILFFSTTILLIFLMFDLFRMIGNDIKEFSPAFVFGVVILIFGIASCIALLAFALLRFLKTPRSDEDT